MSPSPPSSRRLGAIDSLRFPFAVSADGPLTADRVRHVRDVIEAVIFTIPGERVFRPDFGAGAQALVFEPNDTPLWQLTEHRLRASLAEVLRGEVDPSALEVRVTGEAERLEILVRYQIAALGVTEEYRFTA